jgi:outer membrane murein-binding lipoprotein Lpp
MKQFALPLAIVCLVLVVPALSEGGKKEEDLPTQVKKLTEHVEKLQESVKALEARVEAEKLASAALAKQLKKARKDGFTYPAPNIDAKEALLSGLEAYAGERAK